MAIKRANSEYRNVTVEFSNAHDTVDGSEVAQIAAPIDAFKAALEVVADIEGQYNQLGAAGVPDLTDATVLATGSRNNQIHVFTVTTVLASASYEFLYVETKPDATA